MDRKVNPLSQFFLNRWLGAAFCGAILFRLGCSLAEAAETSPAPTLSYRVIAEYPHATERFTQGLAINGNRIIESTGGYRTSRIYINELRSGKPMGQRALPNSVFGEGLAVIAERIFVLTWREGLAFEFDSNLQEKQRFKLPGEGWGLAQYPTENGIRLIQSDGSSKLKILDSRSLKAVGGLDVREGTRPVTRLNELEVARGQILANVWLTPRIALISPATGAVNAWVDLAALYPPSTADSPDNVLNGIAFDPLTGHFFVTGKRWPKIFEIEIDDQGFRSDGH